MKSFTFFCFLAFFVLVGCHCQEPSAPGLEMLTYQEAVQVQQQIANRMADDIPSKTPQSTTPRPSRDSLSQSIKYLAVRTVK